MPYYPYFFTLKYGLCDENTEFFPRSLRLLDLYNTLLYIQGVDCWNTSPNFIFLNKSVIISAFANIMFF